MVLVISAMTPNNTMTPALLPPSRPLAMMAHLLAKPLKAGMPAIETLAMAATSAVIGISLTRPPSWSRSLVPVAYWTLPVLRNSRPLNSAWLMVWYSTPISASTASDCSSGLPLNTNQWALPMASRM